MASSSLSTDSYLIQDDTQESNSIDLFSMAHDSPFTPPPYTLQDEFNDPTPLVLVEGFMGLNKQELWGTFSKFLSEGAGSRPRQIIIVKPGPVSSLHDRACEVYYQLMGGTVDYGEKHSKHFGHERYGRTYKHGLYPMWSPKNPLHFLTHSLGSVTIWKLSQLLQQGFFKDSSPDSILSITAVSAPYRGTTSVYVLGESVEVPAKVSPLSIGWGITRAVHFFEWLDIPFFKSWLYDFNADHWRLSRREKNGRSLFECFRQSPWAEAPDCAPHDLTIHSMLNLETSSRVHHKTYYRSYVTSMTRPDTNGNTHSPIIRLSNFHLWHLSYAVGHFNFPSLPSSTNRVMKADLDEDMPSTLLASLDASQWYENDGIVCTKSQSHPFECRHVSCTHYEGLPLLKRDSFISNSYTSVQIDDDDKPIYKPMPGHFEVFEIKNTTHFELCPYFYGTDKQKRFWIGMGQYLTAVEKAWFAEHTDDDTNDKRDV